MMKLSLLENTLYSPITKFHVVPTTHYFSVKVSIKTTASSTSADTIVSKQLPPHLPHHSYFSNSMDKSTGPVKLGRQWPDYQGARDWDGLLNPLDNNLRSEILRYGNFVEAAYRAFDFDPSSPAYATCRFTKKELLDRTGFHGTGYRLTKNLHATSCIKMPRWTEKAASWTNVQSSWIGYVAVCTDKAEIQRLGRRDVVIALRGTATCLEWMENVRATLTPLPGTEATMVESGFLSLYRSGTGTCQSLRDTIKSEVARILEKYKGEEVSFTMTGHSLGAALAVIAAYDVKTSFEEAGVTVMSFGGPRVGNKRFGCHVEELGIKILRIVNAGDVVTKMPGFVMEDEDLGYAEVGRELRLMEERRRMPSYMLKMNLPKCHDLKTYLNLVEASSVSYCPITETANRFLVS